MGSALAQGKQGSGISSAIRPATFRTAHANPGV
jgi:hypothetical protein